MKLKWRGMLAAMLCAACMVGINAGAAESEIATPSTNIFRYCEQEYQQTEKIGAYMINGNNYVKLRDIAFSMTKGEKYFDVQWNASTQSINLISGKHYTPVGGERQDINSADTQTAVPSTVRIFKDSEPVHWIGYTINGNNYFKLRDIAQTFDFGLRYDSARNRVNMWSCESYADSQINDPTVPEGAAIFQTDLTNGFGLSSGHFSPYCPLQMPENGEYTKEYQSFLNSYEGPTETITIKITHDEKYDSVNPSNPNHYPTANINFALWLIPSSLYNDFNSPVKTFLMVNAVQTDEEGNAVLKAEIPKLLADRTEQKRKNGAYYLDFMLMDVMLDEDGYVTTHTSYSMPDGYNYRVVGGNIFLESGYTFRADFTLWRN